MKLAQDIGRLGFRRWYERQLVESHAYLVTAFLALILLLAGYESLAGARDSPLYYLLLVTAAGGAGMLMFVAWRRFSVLMARAELFAESAACAACGAWGKFEVLAEEPASDDDVPESGRPHWIRVRCRQCGHAWRLG